MRTLLTAFCLLLAPLSATYIFMFDEKDFDDEHKTWLFELILKGEAPRSFYLSEPIDLVAECEKLSSALRLEWIPPSLWQLAVLHTFFNDPVIRDGILACEGKDWDPLQYEEIVHHHLSSVQTQEELAGYFDAHSLSLPNLCQIFFQINQAIASLYIRAGGSDLEMMRLAITEIPPFDQWIDKQFPFWRSPWIYNPKSPLIFYNALNDEGLLSEALKIERAAYKSEEWVLYRGYSGTGYPSTLQLDNSTRNHALSFGSTLLGGAFFSLESCAMAYAQTDSQVPHSFLTLKVTPQELKEYFRVGPLHPLIQMLVDGEMFHAHTKIGTKNSDPHAPLNGYFMQCNKYCHDPLGYITAPTMTPKELEKAFLLICEKSGYILK
jgi:hypothetical protein